MGLKDEYEVALDASADATNAEVTKETFFDFECRTVGLDECFVDSSLLNAFLLFEVVPLESVKDSLSMWLLNDEEGSFEVGV